ncbi:hypothetical protein [Methylobacterium sp. ID0610]|uniref:hypothetical protein n=1 Tax=Methylobacterium carpenticola TaxID=3344827 RepID=UPI0036AB58F8
MIRTATLITATAALASALLTPGLWAEPARIAPGKAYTDRLSAASFAPTAQDVTLFSLTNAGGGDASARPCRGPQGGGARCFAAAATGGILR